MAITASAAGGNWNTNGAWVGGVQPTAADDVILDGTSGNITIPSGTTVFARSLNCTGYTGTFTFAATTSQLDVGDASGGAVTFSAGMTLTLTGVGVIRFLATTASTTYDLTTAGKTMPSLTVQVGASTTIRFADNVTATNGILTLVTGTWDFNSRTVTCTRLLTSGAAANALTMGTANVTMTGASSCTFNTSTVITGGSATLTLTSPGVNFFGPNDVSGSVLPHIIFTGGGSSYCGVGQVGATIAFTNITFTGTAVKTGQLKFPDTNIINISGALTVTGNSVTNRVLVCSQNSTTGTDTSTTPVVLGGSATAKTNCSNVDFKGITMSGGAAGERDFSAITGGSGDAGNNTGITFTTAQTNYYKDNSSDNYSTTANWFLATNGGGGAGRVPLPQDTVIFDANSGSTGTYTFDMPRIGIFDATGFSGTFGFGIGVTFCGNVKFDSMNNTTGGANVFFVGAGSHTLTSSGLRLPISPTFVGPGGTYTLQDDFNCGNNFITLNAGTLNTNGKTVYAGGFTLQVTTGVRTLTLGASTLYVSGAGTPWNVNGTNLTVNAGTSSMFFTNQATTAKTFAGGSKAYNVVVLAGTADLWTITGSNTFNVLRYDGLLGNVFGFRSSRPHPFAPGLAR